jgi:Co/Zn/Cd efflux system component
MHTHEELDDTPRSRQLLKKATIINAAIGIAELAAGVMGGSHAVVADSVHNVGDAAAYGIKWKISSKQTSPEKVRNWRKKAANIVCLGSLVIGGKAVYEIANENYEKPSAATVGVAAVAGSLNVVVASRLHATKSGASAVHHDGLRHAASDVIGSFVTVGAATLAYKGLEIADPVGAVAASGITIYMNYPSASRLQENAP